MPKCLTSLALTIWLFVLGIFSSSKSGRLTLITVSATRFVFTIFRESWCVFNWFLPILKLIFAAILFSFQEFLWHKVAWKTVLTFAIIESNELIYLHEKKMGPKTVHGVCIIHAYCNLQYLPGKFESRLTPSPTPHNNLEYQAVLCD